METIFYILIFIIGALFGSFYTLAVYRIPKRQDILYTHSYCPNCNHKLGLLDLFPIISYIVLGGKCRYCKDKIRPRYLILEVLSGVLFVVVSYSMGLSIYNLNIQAISNAIFVVLYLTFIILIAGIDKETRKMDKLVNIYGIAISIIYMIYLCIVERANIYRYAIYLIAYIVILLVDTIMLRKKAKSPYVNGILTALVTMTIFTGEFTTINTIIITLLAIAISIIILKMKNKVGKTVKSDKKISSKMNIGFYLAVSNVIILVLSLFYNQYIL